MGLVGPVQPLAVGPSVGKALGLSGVGEGLGMHWDSIQLEDREDQAEPVATSDDAPSGVD